MSWVKVDDGLIGNRKINRLTDRAFRLYMAGLCWSATNLTDGVLEANDVSGVCGQVRATRKHVGELVDGELWLPTGGGGYQVKDYLTYNPRADQVKLEREKARERMKRIRSSGERSGEQEGGVRANVRRSFGDPVPSRKDQRLFPDGSPRFEIPAMRSM